MATETISVIILTYNRKRLLKDCLDSLLWQSVPGDEVELLVADDGSDDGTEELVARYRAVHPNIRYLHHPHQGISATRNLGIRAATGEFIAIVADDYILRSRLPQGDSGILPRSSRSASGPIQDCRVARRLRQSSQSLLLRRQHARALAQPALRES